MAVASEQKRTPGRFSKADLARLGKFLREQRQARMMTLRALADRSGLSAAAIRALEAGDVNPSLGTVLAVVDVLGVDLDQMVEAARDRRSNAVVLRADEAASDNGELRGAALAVTFEEVPAGSVAPAPETTARHPSLGMVVDGGVIAALGGGGRRRLEIGDVYHAQPGVLQGLAAVEARMARVLHVTDTRRVAGRLPAPPETEN
jgi:transcriptional regulator with XRE-family HTH domain